VIRSTSLILIAGALVMGVFSSGGARAQYDVEDGDDYSWHYGQERPRHDGSGPRTLSDARASGAGIRINGVQRYRAIPELYTVRRGDTLWDITGHFYGNPWEWPRVWSYNPEITNPHWIYPDDRLRLLGQGQRGASLPTLGITPDRPLERGSVLLRDQGYLDEDALRTSGIIVGSPEEQMLLSVYDDLYIRFDRDEGVRPGMELTVFREMMDDERNPDEEGDLVRIFGTVRLRSYDPERRVGRAVITEALDPIERGYRIANIPRRFELVAAVPNDVDFDTEVVAALRPLELNGDYQVVFVEGGAEQGVKVGNRFFIIRSGDEWRENLIQSESSAGATLPDEDELDDYPEEIIAEGRVVNVRPESSALMITRSITEVVFGDRAEMRRGY
jgi:hypothetical protein